MSRMKDEFYRLNAVALETGDYFDGPDDSDYDAPPTPSSMCDICNQPGTEDNPITRSESFATGETYAHADGCPVCGKSCDEPGGIHYACGDEPAF